MNWDHVTICSAVKRCILYIMLVLGVIAPWALIPFVIAYMIKENRRARKIYGCILWVTTLYCIGAVFSAGDNILWALLYDMGIPELNITMWMQPSRLRGAFVFLFVAIVNQWCTNYLRNADVWMVQQEHAEQDKQIKKVDELPFPDSTEHVCNVGTTGTGKTTYELIYHVMPAIKNKEPLIIISGKNGEKDKKSLLHQTKRLAKKYNREITIVSTDPRYRQPYNPLRDFTVTQTLDALCSLSHFSEEHYEMAFRNYCGTILEALQLAGITFSLPTIIKYYYWDDFVELLKYMKQNNMVSDEKLTDFFKAKGYAEIAKDSRSRFENLLRGEGGRILTERGISAQKCVRDGRIFFLDLDSFKYREFTRALGTLAIYDIRGCMASFPQKKRAKICLDELSYFCDETLDACFSMGRSTNYQLICSFQTLADLRKVSEEFEECVISNSNSFAILRVSGKDAQRLAEEFGTYNTVDTTRKSAGAGLDDDDAGSKRNVNKFVVAPDRLRNLRSLRVIYINKERDNVVYEVKLDPSVLPRIPQGDKQKNGKSKQQSSGARRGNDRMGSKNHPSSKRNNSKANRQ